MKQEILLASTSKDSNVHISEANRLRRYVKGVITRRKLNPLPYKSMFYNLEYERLVDRVTDRPQNQLTI